MPYSVPSLARGSYFHDGRPSDGEHFVMRLLGQHRGVVSLLVYYFDEPLPYALGSPIV